MRRKEGTFKKTMTQGRDATLYAKIVEAVELGVVSRNLFYGAYLKLRILKLDIIFHF